MQKYDDMSSNTCGECIYYTGEECNGLGGSREGCSVYEWSEACDFFEDVEEVPQFEGTKGALNKLTIKQD